MKGLAGLIESVATKGLLAASNRAKRARTPTVPSGFVVGFPVSGAHSDQQEPLILRTAERRKHVYVLGATGCGKSNLLLRMIEDEVRTGRTCVVIDLRGDLIDRIFVRLAATEPEHHPKIRLIDLREDDFVMPFNPLSGTEGSYTRAMFLLEVIRKGSDSWGVQLEETLRNCLIALAGGGYTLLDIERLLFDPAFRESVIIRCPDEHVRSFFERYGRFTSERQQTWSLPVLNKVTPLLSIPQLRRMLGSPEGFNWNEWLDQPGGLVLIALAAHRFHSASHLIGGLLVSSLQSAIMARANLPEGKRNPVTLYVDEFETMATPSFATIIAEGRRFGLSLVLAHQNLSQLDTGLRSCVRNNVFAQVLFQAGASDASELAGDVFGCGPKETVRQALVSQKVGEAFVARRGEATVQVATIYSPDPKIDPKIASDLKLNVLDACCLRSVDVEDRFPSPLGPATSSIAEVRHDKRPKTKRI
jgi:hypothetical protein